MRYKYWNYEFKIDANSEDELDISSIIPYATTKQTRGFWIFKTEFLPTIYLVLSVKGFHKVLHNDVVTMASNANDILSRTTIDLHNTKKITIQAMDTQIIVKATITDDPNRYSADMSLFYDGYKGFTHGILTEDFLQMESTLDFQCEIGRLFYDLVPKLQFYCNCHNIKHNIVLSKGMLSGILYVNLAGKRKDLNGFMQSWDAFKTRIQGG